MKKFAKMSLVAALAVAGMTSANAKDLSEAIKDVDVSGTVVYRYDDRAWDDYTSLNDPNDPTSDREGGATSNNYKIGLSLSSKVNDDVKANTRFIVGSDSNSFASMDTNEQGDGNVNVKLSTVNFSYTGIKNTTVIVGKQGLQTPWTNAIDSDGSEQTGTGILGITTWGPVTAAAGYFNQTNISSNGDNLAVAGLIGSFAGVNAEAWYLEISDDLDSTYLGANYKFNVGAVALGLDAKYTTLDFDSESADYVAGEDDHGNWEAGITAKMGIFNAGFAYAETDKDGSGILNSVAKNGQIGYSVNIQDANDAEMYMYDLGAQVLPNLHVALNYDEVKDSSNNKDQKEYYTQITYKMSKNLMAYVRLASGEAEKGTGAAAKMEDYNRGRLQVQYSF